MRFYLCASPWLSYKLLWWVCSNILGGFLQPNSVPCQWYHPSISLPLQFLLLGLCSQKQADVTPCEDFITEQSLPSILSLCANQRAASPSKWGPREWGLVQGSHKAKLASPVGFLLPTESGVLSDIKLEQPLLFGWLAWTQLLLGFLLLSVGARTGAASVTSAFWG